MSVPFTQFLRPHGRAKQTSVNLPPDVEELAHKLIEDGARFEIEVLTTGMIYMGCFIGDTPITNALCKNEPIILKVAEDLVREAYRRNQKPEDRTEKQFREEFLGDWSEIDD